MKTAYIFHDAFSDPMNDWYPWMKTTLEAMGYLVVVPVFPTPAAQSWESWRAVIKNYWDKFDEESIFIGHGTGGIFALRILENLQKQIHGLFLIASYGEKIGHAGYDRVNETFLGKGFDWQKIKYHAMVIEIFAGDNDPFVPIGISQKLAQNLGKPLQVIPDGGHLNKASGFVQAVPIAQGIKEALQVISGGIEKVTEVITDVVAGGHPAQVIVPEAIPVAPGGPNLPPSENRPSSTPHTAHTMYQDMGTVVNSNQGFVASSLLNKARTDIAVKKASNPTSVKNILYAIGGFVSILAALTIGGYLFIHYLPATTNPVAPKIPSLVTADTHQKIEIGGKESYTIATAIREALDAPLSEKTIRDIYYVSGDKRISFPKVLDALTLSSIPDSLSNQFNIPYFMHGEVGMKMKNAHFLVIPFSSYDIAFAQMREWEPMMIRDVGIFMDVPETFLRTKMTRDSFHDELITNKNVRVLRYQKPIEITSEPEPSLIPSLTITPPPISTTTQATSPVPVATSPVNFISEGIETIQEINPFLNPASPYTENDIILAYFFLNEKTVIIVDDVSIIDEILKRYTNQQIYQ